MYDLVIIGAGPAGLVLANEVSKKGFSVIILEKKKDAGDIQYTTLGSFINKDEWDIPEAVLYKINKLHFASKNFSFERNGFCNIIDRRGLLKHLEKKAISNGAKILYSTAIINIEINNEKVSKIRYKHNGREKVAIGQIFADCSGNSMVLASKINSLNREDKIALGAEFHVPLKSQPNTADLYIGKQFKEGYGWLFPLSKKEAILGYGTFNKSNFKKIRNLLEKMFEIERVKERVEFKQLEYHVSVFRTGHPIKKFVKNNIVLIGDTAIQGNPLVGEGVRFVMDSARIASKHIIKAIKNQNNNLLHKYEKEWSKKYYRKYKLAYNLQEKMQDYSKSDRKSDNIAQALSRLPDKEFKQALSGDISYLWLIKRISRIMLNKIFSK